MNTRVTQLQYNVKARSDPRPSGDCARYTMALEGLDAEICTEKIGYSQAQKSCPTVQHMHRDTPHSAIVFASVHHTKRVSAENDHKGHARRHRLSGMVAIRQSHAIV
jgi:hypothetical protein